MRDDKHKPNGFFTGAIGTKFNRKEFEVRKQDIKFMKDECCSSLHLVLIRQTPPAPVSMQNPLSYNESVITNRGKNVILEIFSS